MVVYQQTKQQVEQYIEEIEAHDFNTIYTDIEFTDDVDPLIVSQFTQLMIKVDVDPLKVDPELVFIPKYYLCDAKIEEITIPSRIQSIGKRAFENCKQLTKVTFEENSKCTHIGDHVFAGSGIEEIILPEGLEYIFEETFIFCTKLKKVVIPHSVKDVEYGAFDNCPNLKELVYKGTMREWEDMLVSCFESEEDFVEKVVCSDGVIHLQQRF